MGKPIQKKPDYIEPILRAVGKPASPESVNFQDAELAYRHLSDEELQHQARIYRLMNYSFLVDVGSKLALLGLKINLPGVEWIAKNTLFNVFIGGQTLLQSLPTIERLEDRHVYSALNYGVEAAETETAFNQTMSEVIRAIEFAADTSGITVVIIKLTGLGRFDLFEDMQARKVLSMAEKEEYKVILKRVDSICHIAVRHDVAIWIDAEESWIQEPIDHIATMMMRRYNRQKSIVFNTVQLYRTDRLQFLIDSYEYAQTHNFKLGVKLVRGAYMDKERKRAKEKGYPSPIHPTKAATDDAFNTGVRFCLDNLDVISVCTASHNEKSNLLQVELMHQKNIPADHPQITFCQLYGMSDHITFPLAAAGFNALKYLPYGPIKKTVPYLIRRAEENESVANEVGGELAMMNRELQRRKKG